ncbi:multiple monosaccharide ABC transporter substrate-binding protein [Pseudomonas sp. R5(2019)]|uniref:multiple monosaccharide ABC transporter substrate-binding protein n=1 Tax=Pseudomonas sp. R5(2019) TaxID=2697566 RepID=UPI0014127CB2|nr:multiple monosaccharide ABC transporter substrate-binding protein [Pseudomonas sp. R5(2019)]NBA95726.1 substrate-binding domain-containing protein [Pseudomonas sp. R5(2019)]
MRTWIKLAATVIVAAAVVGCSKEDETSKGVIGISLPSKMEARWVSDGDSMVEKLHELGYKTDIQYAQYEIPTQLSQLENLLVKGVKGLIIAPIDGTTMADVLKQAKEKGITIISYDRLIRNSKNFDYYATFDNYKVGVLQGESIVKALSLDQGQGPFNFEIFAGSTDDNNAHVVYAGVMSVLKPYLDSGKLVIRSGQVKLEQVATPNWDGSQAQSRMDNLLSAFYGKAHLDAVLAMNDQIAIGVVSSLRGVGYGNGGSPMPVVTGQDAEIPSVKAIVRGDQHSTVFKDTRALAEAASLMMDGALQGKPVAVNDTTSYDNGMMIVPTQLLAPVLVEADNWKKVLVDTGFYSEDRLR